MPASAAEHAIPCHSDADIAVPRRACGPNVRGVALEERPHLRPLVFLCWQRSDQ